MIADHKKVSKFINWAVDTKFADFSVWGPAHIAQALDGDGKGGKK